MLTWRLWRALRYPDEDHPLFARLGGQRKRPTRWHFRRYQPLIDMIEAIAETASIVIAPVLLVIGANFLGAVVAFNITQAIQHEHERGTYDLLALTPFGRGVVSWQIAIICTDRLKAIRRLMRLRILALVTLVLLIMLSLSGIVFTPILLLMLIVALNLDAVQTLIVGCLSGMLAQETGSDTLFAPIALFALVQLFVVYLPVILLILGLHQWLFPLQLDSWVGDGLVASAALIALFFLREAIIRLMWRELKRRLL